MYSINFKSRNINFLKGSPAIELVCSFKHCQVQYIMYCRNVPEGGSGLFFRDKIFMLQWGFSIAFLSQQIFHTPGFNSFCLGKYAVKAKAGHIFYWWEICTVYCNTQRLVKKVTDNRHRQSTAKNRHPRPDNQELTTSDSDTRQSTVSTWKISRKFAKVVEILPFSRKFPRKSS